MNEPLAVFLISFNRGAMLRCTINALRRQDVETEVVVHDNGSTDPETLDTLSDLASAGIIIKRRGAIFNADDLNKVDETVQDYFSGRPPARYAVSDCDVDLSISSPSALRVYGEMLDRFTEVECVGPMLRIRDIPLDYPLYNRVMNRHISRLWHKEPSWCDTSLGRVAYQACTIDTTFALHRKSEPFRRLKSALRLYEPYEAKHLDWYHRVIGSDIYATTSSAGISHWNNITAHDVHHDVALEFDNYFYVRAEFDGPVLCQGSVAARK